MEIIPKAVCGLPEASRINEPPGAAVTGAPTPPPPPPAPLSGGQSKNIRYSGHLRVECALAVSSARPLAVLNRSFPQLGKFPSVWLGFRSAPTKEPP